MDQNELLKDDIDNYDDPEDFRLPPRRHVHPSEKQKTMKFFYRTLLILFLGLTAGLIGWGFHANGVLLPFLS